MYEQALALIRDSLEYLKEQPDQLFASPDDCDYYRSLYSPKPKALPPINLLQTPPPELKRSIPTPEKKPLSPEPKPKEPEPKIEEPPAPVFSLQPPKKADSDPFIDVKKILSRTAPYLHIFEEVPSDETAKKIASRWKTKNQVAPISILSYHEPPKQRRFLEEIAKAVDIYFGPARIISAEQIEKEKQWEVFLDSQELKLVILCDYALWQLGGLMEQYKENPVQKEALLGKVPIFLLPDLSLYLKDPPLKRSLWRALCQKIQR